MCGKHHDVAQRQHRVALGLGFAHHGFLCLAGKPGPVIGSPGLPLCSPNKWGAHRRVSSGRRACSRNHDKSPQRGQGAIIWRPGAAPDLLLWPDRRGPPRRSARAARKRPGKCGRPRRARPSALVPRRDCLRPLPQRLMPRPSAGLDKSRPRTASRPAVATHARPDLSRAARSDRLDIALGPRGMKVGHEIRQAALPRSRRAGPAISS